MPPKASKPVKDSGRDIRSFFGSSQPTVSGTVGRSQQQGTPVTPKRSQRVAVIELSDDDEKKKKQDSPSQIKPLRPSEVKGSNNDVDVSEKGTPQQPRRSSTSMKRKKITALLSSDEEEEESARKEKRKRDIEPPSKKEVAVMPASSPARPRPSRESAAAPSASRKISKAQGKMTDDYEMDVIEDGDFINDDDDDDLIPTKSKKKIKPPTTRKAVPKEVPPSVNAKPDDVEPAKPKFNWAAAKAARLAGPKAPGSKPVPEPASENCLAGLSFVFTGELSSLSRDEAIELAKRHGGRVVGQPSSKTSYVVLGENAGQSKLAAIEKHKLTSINEDEFLNLIATRVVREKDLDANTRKKMQKEKEAIRQAAQEIDKREKGKAKAAGSSIALPVSSQLWTTRYAPQTLKEICGNKGQIEKLQQWLHDWPQNVKAEFKKPGKHGMNVFRAVMITGSPGIGKTTSAHLCARLQGFNVVELNASDSRSKKLVENGVNINNTSLDGWMGKGETTNSAGVVITDRSCIIMDEVDGMSAGDRGGVGALNALIKKSKIPIICIANDRGAQKLKPLMHTTFSLPFRKPEASTIRSRIMTVLYKEKMKVPANVVDQLVEGAQSDIRQVLNMLSTWRLSSDTMDFDQGKGLVKMNEKYSILSPFDVTHKMLGPHLFSGTSRETLGDKMELYFHDHSFIPLFIQENYLKIQPARARNYSGPERSMKELELMDKAASSISDGDLVDAMIHGSEQHWSLMPLHAVCSTVRPASFFYGVAGGYGSSNAISFPQWLGQNSKQAKLYRQLRDVQIRMRLRVSGNATEIRQSYMPALFPHIVQPLVDVGASAVDEVIRRMDEYYLSKEDWDTVVELGLDQNKDDLVLKRITTATKTQFTRKYNVNAHPIAYHKSQDLGKPPKKIAAQSAPDLEEAFDIEDEVEEDEKPKPKSKDDVFDDKLIQAAKKGKGKGKSKK